MESMSQREPPQLLRMWQKEPRPKVGKGLSQVPRSMVVPGLQSDAVALPNLPRSLYLAWS